MNEPPESDRRWWIKVLVGTIVVVVIVFVTIYFSKNDCTDYNGDATPCSSTSQ